MNELVWAAQELFKQGLAWGSSGNISAKQDQGLLISKSGTFFSCMTEQDFVLVNGSVPKDASSQIDFHQGVHGLTADKFVMLIHPPNSVAVSLLDTGDFTPDDDEGKFFFGAIPIISVNAKDDMEKAKKVSEKMGEKSAALIRGTGILLTGNDVKKMVALACAIDFSAKVWLRTHSSQLPL